MSKNVDPISLNLIPDNRKINILTNGKYISFNANSLARMIIHSVQHRTPIKNPISRKSLSNNQIKNVFNRSSSSLKNEYNSLIGSVRPLSSLTPNQWNSLLRALNNHPQ